jgi:drug/metabolite transporter (DMT)-like permease
LLSGLRLLLAVPFLFPFFWNAWRRSDPLSRRWAFTGTFLPGLVLAFHFMFWTLGARNAPTATASLIVNMAPLVMPFFLWIALREKVYRIQWLGTLVAFGGVVLLVSPRLVFQSGSMMGEGYCLLAMILFAVYLTLGRLNRRMTSLWLYLVPVYLWAGFISLAVAFAQRPSISAPSPLNWLWLLLLALLPTVFGHGLINYCLRHLRGQTVAVANQGQFIFAMPMAAFFFHEYPTIFFYPAAAIVLGGCWLATREGPKVEEQSLIP